MSVGNAIEVDHVSKQFKLGSQRNSSLKERVVNRRSAKVKVQPFMALQDIAFDVPQGSTIGLLGHNGSGKSTMLKCIGGILRPTSGEIRRTGRLASLLELGAGFHPDLTGRENIYLNAAILGMTKAEIDARFDDIVAFSEIEQFIDSEVKHYSSGMFLRLAFSVAIHTEVDILLIDEILSVGDEPFQKKCLARIRELLGVRIDLVSVGPDRSQTILLRQPFDRLPDVVSRFVESVADRGATL